MPRVEDLLFDVADLDRPRGYDRTYDRTYRAAAGTVDTGGYSLYPGLDGGFRVLGPDGLPRVPEIFPPRPASERGAPEISLASLATSLTLATAVQRPLDLGLSVTTTGVPYVFEYRLLIQRNYSGTAIGWVLNFDTPDTLVTSLRYYNYEISTSTTTLLVGNTTGSIASGTGMTTFLQVVDVEGVLLASTPGTWTPVLNATTTTGTCVVQAGSWGVIHRL